MDDANKDGAPDGGRPWTLSSRCEFMLMDFVGEGLSPYLCSIYLGNVFCVLMLDAMIFRKRSPRHVNAGAWLPTTLDVCAASMKRRLTRDVLYPIETAERSEDFSLYGWPFRSATQALNWACENHRLLIGGEAIPDERELVRAANAMLREMRNADHAITPPTTPPPPCPLQLIEPRPNTWAVVIPDGRTFVVTRKRRDVLALLIRAFPSGVRLSLPMLNEEAGCNARSALRKLPPEVSAYVSMAGVAGAGVAIVSSPLTSAG